MGSTSRASTLTKKDQVDQLESAMAEIGRVKEENKILKMNISKIMEDYQSLYVYLKNFVRQKGAKASEDTAPTNQEIEETEISLSLGSISGEPKKEEKSISSSKCEGSSKSCWKEPMNKPSPKTSFEEQKEEEAGQTWSPNKILGTKRSSEDDEAAQQIQVKKARVSVRARCDTPTMNDGCQWRKYGQKISKGSPCPRAYYRCIVAPTCPVKKRVQRCAHDMSLLITTYEGNHNHPLSVSATAMASTTSAAASVLMSGSSNSRATLTSSTNTSSTDLHGLNISKQFYLPNSSISSSPSYPTINLDLTVPSTSSSSQFNSVHSSFRSIPGYITSSNFSALESSVNAKFGDPKSHVGSLILGKRPQEHFHLPYMQKNNPTPPQQPLSETIAAATKVITSDPTFRSVLEAAITSMGNKASAGENFG